MVGFLGDGDFGNKGEMIDFLGKKAMIPKGPAAFAQKTGAPIVPAFLIREGDYCFRMVLEPPIYPKGTDEGALIALIKEYTAVIESKVREYPTQWLMFREFWVK